MRIAPAKPSTTYQVKVRPISRLEVPGEFSSYGSVSSAAFVVPTVTFSPTTPSAPTVTAAVYTLLVTWTALTDVTSGYGHYDVQIATDAGFTANVRTKSIDGTITSFSDLTPGTTYYARVRGVAPDGTAGTFSSAGSATTAFIVTNDIAANAITAAKIAADTITANELAANSVTAAELSAISLAVGKYLRSTTYTPGSAGWSINADGSAEFSNVTARGYLLGSNIVQSEGGDLLNNGGGAPADYDGDLSGQQILSNPKFDTNITGWEANANCTVARVTTAGTRHSGAGALETTGTNTSQASARTLAANGSRIPVTAGHVYTFAGWVRTAATARSTNVQIKWYDASNSVISTSSGTRANDSTTYGHRFVTATAPAGAVTAVLIVEFGTTTGAVSEKHQFDDAAFWDRTAFEALGWSFHANVTPSLSYNPNGDLCILCNMTDGTDVWYIESPQFTIDATRAYRATFSVMPNESTIEGYSGEAQLVFNKAGTPETDGALASPTTSVVVESTYDNFSSGGDGVATLVTPTTVNARFGHPYAPVNIAAVGNVWLRNFKLQTSGQVTGHINPQGPIQGLQGGRYASGSTTGSATAGAITEVFAGSTFSLSTAIQNSDPGGYSDTTVARRIHLSVAGSFQNLGAGTEETLLLRYSLDGGTTFKNIHRAKAGLALDGAGYEQTMLCEGWFYCPVGVDPVISVQESHASGATATTFSNVGMSWLIIPG